MLKALSKPAPTRLLCAALVLCSFDVLAASSQSYRFEVWNTERGLPQNTVLSIVQSRDGYLWIGTRFGLARFDGVRFTIFNVANTPGMPCENCYTMAEDAEGSLWIGTNEGLMRRKNNIFQLFTTDHHLAHNNIREVIPGPSGAVWVGTSRGFSRFLDGQFTNLIHEVGPMDIRTEVLEDRSGCLWYNTGAGLFRMPLRTGRPELIAPEGQAASERAFFFLEDANANIWFGNYAGLFCWSNHTLIVHQPKRGPGLGENHPTLVQTAFQTRAGELFVTVSERSILHRFQDGVFVPFPGPGSAPIEYVNCGLEDREGNLWIGSQFNGLIAAQHRVVSVISEREGLGHDNVLTVCEGRDGVIWAGSSGANISRIKGDVVDSFAIPNGSGYDVASIFEDAAGTVWIGTEKGTRERSLFRMRNGIPEHFSVEAGIMSDTVSAIYQDRSGALWFGTADGLYRFQDGRSMHFTSDNGLSTNDVRAIVQDRSGAVWVGTYGGGINILRDGKVSVLTTRNGLSSNFAWAFHEDSDGVMWVGTEAGLNRCHEGSCFVFTRKHGLFDDLVNSILEDHSGNIWISCNRGIYRVNRRGLNDIAEGRATSVRHIAYGVSDGMLSSETNGENQPAGCKGRDGRLWFPTIQGLAVIDPSRAQDNSVEPPVVVEQVTVDDEVVIGNGLIVPKPQPRMGGKHFALGARRGQVMQIQYAANSFVSADKLRFKYRLEGHDRDWREGGIDRVAYYTNLKPGNYHFQVIAANSHDRWNNRGAAFTFSIAPHFTQTPEFKVLIGLTLAGLALTGHTIRLRFLRRLQRAEQFQALETERSRIAKDMHDDLGSSLTQISLLTELASRDAKQPEDFKAHLQRIGETTRGVFYSLDEIIWATNPKNDALESLVSFIANYAQDFLRLAGIACRLEFPQSLPPSPVSAPLRHDLLLAVKEALNNIVKHSGATEVWFRATWAFRNLTLTITDNGCGLRRGNGHPGANGDGIINMQQRLRANGGQVFFENAPTGGTVVRLVIPVHERSSARA